MATHNVFRRAVVVPTWQECMDAGLACTKGNTSNSEAASVRACYAEKVRKTCEKLCQNLTFITDSFPKLAGIHPFYADLLHLLCNKEQYTLALGQIEAAKYAISKICEDSLGLMESAERLYRCRCVKVVAVGRMFTVAKDIGSSFITLEDIRQQMVWFPSINPSIPSIIICGCPKTGKSSFMKKIASIHHADDQPVPLPLFIGHTHYKFLQYQVIDTPSILHRDTEDERNTEEMCTITALKHLRAAVLFFLDVDGRSGYTLAEQVATLNGIKPYLMDKLLVIVSNKDLRSLNLSKDDMKLLQGIEAEDLKTTEFEQLVITMESLGDDHVRAVKEAVCEKLLSCEIQPKLIHDKDKPFSLRPVVDEACAFAVAMDTQKKTEFLDLRILLECEEVERVEGIRMSGASSFQIDGKELTKEERAMLRQAQKARLSAGKAR